MAQAFRPKAAVVVSAAHGGHFQSGTDRPLVFRQRPRPVRHPAALPFRRGALAAMMPEIVRCLLILALAQFIAMPLRGLNTAIKQHFAPSWPNSADQPRR